MKGRNTGKKVFILKSRVYIYCVSFILAVILLLTAVFSIDLRKEISFYYSPMQTGAVVLCGDKALRAVVPGKSVARVRYCEDKVSGAVLMSEGSSYSLYYVTDNGIERIADNCTSNFVMSHNGDAVVYIATDGFMYRTDTSRLKTVTVDENVECVAVSPDGKIMLYSKKTDNVSKLYIYAGDEPVYLADNYIPVAVSDDSSLIYVLSADNSLYLLNTDGTVRSKLCSETDTGIFCFSSDVSSVIFNDGAYTYMSETGKSKVRLIQGKAVPVHITTKASLCNSSGTVYVYPEKKLTELLYVNADGVNDYSLSYINKDMTRTDISSGVVNYTLTDKGVVYLKSDGEICNFRKNNNAVVCSGASDMYASSDGKYIYYTSSDGKFYSYRKSEAVLLANGVDKMYMSDDDRLFFIMTDGSLYSAKNGRTGEMIDENVYTCRCVGDTVYYSKNYSSRTGAFELYGAENSMKFRFVADGLTRI